MSKKAKGPNYYELSTVEYLRALGFKVRVHYKRYPTAEQHPVALVLTDDGLQTIPPGGRIPVLYPYSPTKKFDPELTGKPSQHWTPFPRGGACEVTLTPPEEVAAQTGVEVLVGESKCHSKDNFDQHVGLRKALVRTHWWTVLS